MLKRARYLPLFDLQFAGFLLCLVILVFLLLNSLMTSIALNLICWKHLRHLLALLWANFEKFRIKAEAFNLILTSILSGACCDSKLARLLIRLTYDRLETISIVRIILSCEHVSNNDTFSLSRRVMNFENLIGTTIRLIVLQSLLSIAFNDLSEAHFLVPQFSAGKQRLKLVGVLQGRWLYLLLHIVQGICSSTWNNTIWGSLCLWE